MPVLVGLFAVCAFIAARLEAARALGSAKTGPVIVHLLLALAGLAAGVGRASPKLRRLPGLMPRLNSKNGDCDTLMCRH